MVIFLTILRILIVSPLHSKISPVLKSRGFSKDERVFAMPFYEYRCEACGHTLEVMQKMSADPLQECPECHAPALKKLMSVTGLVKSSSHGGGGHSCGSGGCSSCH